MTASFPWLSASGETVGSRGRARFGWIRGRAIGAAVTLSLLASLAIAVPGGSAVAEEQLAAREVRTVHTSAFGVDRPGGIAWSPDAGFLIAEAGGSATSLVRLGVGEELLGRLDLTGTEGVDLGTLTIDPSGDLVALADDTLVEVPADALLGRRATARQEGSGIPSTVRAPAGATHDEDGTLLVLDAATDQLVPVEGDTDPVALEVDGDLRGLAFNPEDGLLYVLDASSSTLHGVDDDGRVQRSYTLDDVTLHDPQDIVFAPSSSTTDAPQTMNLFVADAGDDDLLGGVTEVTLAQVEVANVPTVTAHLVQTIDTSRWVPASPDPSGVTYLPGPDLLTVVDSEVNETTGAGYHGVNVWEVTRRGVVQRGWTTLAFTNEPTGVGHDPASNTLFISTDGGTSGIHIVRAGRDGVFGTPDDQRSFLNLAVLGVADAEDPEFDPATGHLFFADGINTRIGRVDPVNGVFGDADDVITFVDLGHHGPTDIEGLAIDQQRGTMLAGDRRSRRIYEVEKTGELVRIIDARMPGMMFLSGMSMAPASDDSGRNNIWIVDRAVDNGADPDENDGKLFELSLDAPGNRAPVITSLTISPTSPRTNDTLTANVQASDPDGDNVSVQYQWRKNGIDLPGRTSRTLDLSQPGNGDRGDEITVRVTASDGQLQDVRTSTAVTVRNTAPRFDENLPDRSDAEGASVDIRPRASDVDGDSLRYEAAGLPPGVTIDPATGRITGTIAAGAATGSPYRASVTVHDDTPAPDHPPTPIGLVQQAASDASGVSELTVTYGSQPRAGNLMVALGHYAGNRVPTIPVGWSLAFESNTSGGETVVFYRVADEGESSGVTLQASGEPTFISLSVFEYAGMHDVQSEVLDRFVFNLGQTVEQVSTGTTPPTGHADDLLLASVGLNATRTFADAWNNGFTQRVDQRRQTVAERIVSVRGEYETSETWTGGAVNSAVGSLVAFKGAGAGGAPGIPDPGSATQTFTWTVTAPSPAPPVVTNVSVTPTHPRTDDVLTATATATGQGPLTFAYQWLRDGTPLSGETGATLDLSKPGNGDKGETLAVRVVATGAGGTSAPVTSASVTVRNSAPVFTRDLPDRTDVAGASVSLSAAASDPDGDTLTYTAANLPAGVSIDARTGAITGTIATGAAGQYAVEINVTDGETAASPDGFTWTITPVVDPGDPGPGPGAGEPVRLFPDVPPGSYYAEPVRWMVGHGITDGYGNTGEFRPHNTTTRAQMAAFIWRMMGRPGGAPHHGFPDVPSGSYYDAAVRWMKDQGITDGYGNTGRFEPHRVVTRGEMASFLWRTAGRPAGDPRHDFPDVPPSAHYHQAVSWMLAKGITNGMGNTGLYAPASGVTRAQTAAFLHRMASNPAAWQQAPTVPPTVTFR